MVAADSVSGCSLALHHAPDLIVLDISLPGGSGIELAERFRQLPETRDIPFIFITASKDIRFRAQAMRLRAAGFLEKPYDPEELLALANHALARRDLTDNDRAWAAISGKNGRKEILIIEDDPRIALGLRLRLDSAGYHATLAGDALSGINAAVRIRPDLVLLDISMPAGNGLDLARQIQASVSPHLPIIFLTASKRPDLKDKAEELGAFAFFEKPYEGEALLAAVRRALSGRRSGMETSRIS